MIIIGAGAAGLAAMNDLLENGYRVCMLEAAPHAGGRIATINDDQFDIPIETGAEFIHGKLPLTIKFLKKAGISYQAIEGDMIGVQNGVWAKDEHDAHWGDFMSKLRQLKNDVTILEFLSQNFPDDGYKTLRERVQRFAEGFNLADISKASILSIRDEWKNIDKKQFRVKGGYTQLVNYLLERGLTNGASVYYNTSVSKIEHGEKVIVSSEKLKFEGDRALITVPVGVLQSGTLQFDPALSEHAVAIQGIGYGTVIKFFLQFKTNFWTEFDDDIGFILSDEEIPTWWTQLPVQSNLLTGWLGGPKAGQKVFEKEEDLLQLALHSLSSIFQMPVSMIREELDACKVINWQSSPHIKGGYSYNTLNTAKAKQILAKPVNNVIYFAGEAVSQGDSQGTVESALQSGIDAASLIMNESNK